jgi:type II secretory pathway component PulF
MHAGIPVVDALDTALSTIDNSFLHTRFASVKVSVQRGSQFAEAIRQTGIYEGMLIQMIDAGEKTGSLDEMLGRVSDYYKSRFDNIVDNIAAYVEPILLVFIASAVLLLGLGIFMPMWDMAKAAKN